METMQMWKDAAHIQADRAKNYAWQRDVLLLFVVFYFGGFWGGIGILLGLVVLSKIMPVFALAAISSSAQKIAVFRPRDGSGAE